VTDAHDLTARIGAMPPGDSVNLAFTRKGQTKTAKVTLTERDLKQLGQTGDDDSAQSGSTLGMALSASDPRTGRPAGGLLVVGVETGSAAAEAGIRKGDVIVEVNQRQVTTPEEVAAIVAKEGKTNGAVLVLVKRQGQPVFRSIPVQ
jgi:serine protease Do